MALLQPLRARLRTLWRRAFPVRVVILYRFTDPKIPDALDAHGDPLPPDDLLPELVNAYKTAPAVFAWLGRELARKEKQYHQLPPVGPGTTSEDMERWRRTQEGLNSQLYALGRAMRIPILAQNRIEQIKKLAEARKANEAELAALRNFFEET